MQHVSAHLACYANNKSLHWLAQLMRFFMPLPLVVPFKGSCLKQSIPSDVELCSGRHNMEEVVDFICILCAQQHPTDGAQD